MTLPRFFDDDIEKWNLKEHTKVKHTIFASYIKPWASILSSFNKRLVIVDGFAGRGRYIEEGQDVIKGSPIIMMDLSRKAIVEELICVCIEKNENNYNDLCGALEEKKSRGLGPDGKPEDYSNVEIVKVQDCSKPEVISTIADTVIAKYVSMANRTKPTSQKTKIFVLKGEFEDIMTRILAAINSKIKQGRQPAPIFLLIDPFGFHGIPLQLIQSILALPKSEILLTFMSRDINRFNPLAQEQIELAKLFGQEDWRAELEKLGQKGQDAFTEYYRAKLKNGVEYVLKFGISESERRQALYQLMHACNELKAIEVMKDNMYKINPDLTYHGPDEDKKGVKQSRLEFESHPLATNLLTRYKGKSASFIQIRRETMDMNNYPVKIYRSVIQQMAKEGTVRIEHIQSKKYGLMDNDIVHFEQGTIV